MFLDAATLHDLDVLSTSPARGPTLLRVVDRTRTRAGGEQLRHRLVASAHSAESILALQQAHQVLAAEALNYRTIVDDADSDGVERYLNSTWQHPDARPGLTRFAEGLWRPAWYRRYLGAGGNGQVRVVALLSAAMELRKQLSIADATVLQDIGAAIALQLDKPDAHDLLRLGNRR